MQSTNIKTYSELVTLPSFKERFEYLRLDGSVGQDTFGYDRYVNQVLYKSAEWKRIRREVILRDKGCDLGCEDYAIYGRALIHHMNPITLEDIINRRSIVFDLENLITTVHNTHNAIHYGNYELVDKEPIIRKRNDTCPWRH